MGRSRVKSQVIQMFKRSGGFDTDDYIKSMDEEMSSRKGRDRRAHEGVNITRHE